MKVVITYHGSYYRVEVFTSGRSLCVSGVRSREQAEYLRLCLYREWR